MNNSSPKRFLGPLLAVLVIVAVFALGFLSGRSNMSEVSKDQALSDSLNGSAGQPSGVDFSLFWKVWGILDEKYVKTHGLTASSTSATSTVGTTATSTSNQDRVYGAIEGMVNSLGDPYTTFFPPEQATQFETQIDGNFQGVGLEMGIKDGALTVISALKGSPAEKAGLKTGDIVTQIDGTSTDSLTIDQAVSAIRGDKGTTVTLMVARTGVDQPMTFKLTRDVINLPTLDSSYDKKTNIFTIKLYSFTSDSASLFRNALRDFVDSKSHKLIIDLRGNPGGFLDAAVDMASWFLPPGVPVVREDYGQSQPETVEKSLGYNIFNSDLKMVILVDGGSASAAEILSGALSEYGKATLVGTKTFGKGSVQEYIKVTPDTALKVTIARWLTPNGKSISEEGLTPDVIVPITDDDIAAGRDPQMDKAVEILSQS